MHITEHDGPIIVFDAECILCSANAQFVLTRDRVGRFRLASMQGEAGSALFRRHGIDPADPDTLIVVDGDRVLRDSDAILSIYAGLWLAPAGGIHLQACASVRARPGLSFHRPQPLSAVWPSQDLLASRAGAPNAPAGVILPLTAAVA